MSAGDWRAALADALDEQAAAIRVALAELENVHAVLEGRGNGRLCTEIRALTAGLRSEAGDLEGEALTLRAKLRDQADPDHPTPRRKR